MLKNTIRQDFNSNNSDENHASVLFIDLDFFKNVNDTLGHHAGDLLLTMVAQRIQTVVDKDCMIARIGGDEFIVYQKNNNHTITSVVTKTRVTAKKIIKTLSNEFSIAGNAIFISASIGIAIMPRDAISYEQVMQRVDIAMYQAKSKGRNDFVRFKKNMEKDIFKKQKLIGELRDALDKSEFFIDYQPQINGDGNQIIGLEALLRWQHSSGKIIQPNDFISIIEECGLILKIGDWVIEEVFMQLKIWLNKFKDIPFISINISVLQLHNDKFILNLKRLMRKYKIPKSMIEFEVTESVMIEQLEKTLITLSKLKKMGIRLSIDDFGTGYSSLSYLKKLPFDKLKIDYSFIKDITNDADTKTIVQTIIGMSQDLDLDVIAEGVENKKQVNLLKKLGCNKFQGFYFDKPSSVEYIEKKYLVNINSEI